MAEGIFYLLVAVFNRFIEIKFMYHKTHIFKVHNLKKKVHNSTIISIIIIVQALPQSNLKPFIIP